MEIRREKDIFWLQKENAEIGRCMIAPLPQSDAALPGCRILWLTITPGWRRRGYGSYLLKEVLRATGGYGRGTASLHTAPLPQSDSELAFWQRFDFSAAEGQLCRIRRAEFTALDFTHQFLAARIPRGGFAIDATCGTGGDTEFLCRAVGSTGRVLALDVQPEAVRRTTARLTAAGLENARVLCRNHALLAQLAEPDSADCIVFNFGWLPGADHTVYSTAGTSIPALAAALKVLKPGGVLAAALYSGKVIGDAEKQAVLAFLRALPLQKYTVLVCEFANWASTAPLPCFVLKK